MTVKRYQPEGFSERLRSIVQNSELTNNEIIRRTGIGRSSFYNLLNGDSVTNITILSRLCTVLNVSADYLLFGRKR